MCAKQAINADDICYNLSYLLIYEKKYNSLLFYYFTKIFKSFFFF